MQCVNRPGFVPVEAPYGIRRCQEVVDGRARRSGGVGIVIVAAAAARSEGIGDA